MKKLKVWILMAFAAVVLLAFAACKPALGVPTIIGVDMNNTLSWNAVSGARRYILEITDVDEDTKKEYSSNKASYSLSSFDEGDYEIRIKAVAGNEDSKDSPWSEICYFKKAYQTGCVYKLVNNIEYHITHYGTASDTVVIEDYYRGKPVTSIAEKAFKGSRNIREVVVGNNVVSIGDNAFYNCPNLRSIVLPDSLETIGAAAFHSCPSLTSISIPDKVKVINSNTFMYCRGLTSIEWGKGLVSIGESAFSNCSGLKELTLPDSLETVGAYAFSEASSLESLTLGKNVRELGTYAFLSCKALTDIHFANEGALTFIGEYAFADCTALEAIAIPEGTTEIGYAAFYKCTALQTVSLPDSIRYIRQYAFSAAGFYADAVNAGDQFVYVDGWLLHCTTKTAKETVDEIERYTFTKLEESSFAEGTIGIADYAFSESKGLETVRIPSSVKYLGDYAFYNCTSLYNVNLSSSSIEEIGEWAFAKCSSLNVLTLQKNNGSSPIRRIGAYSFYKCSSLNNTRGDSFIPKSVTSIGTYAFRDTALWASPAEDGVIYAGTWIVGYDSETIGKEVELKEGTVGIADYGFYNCTTLSTLIGLDSVKNLGYAAFYKCSSLERAYLNTDITVIQPYTFYKCTSLFDVTLPSNLTTIGRSAFYKCESLNALDLSEVWTQEDEEGNTIWLTIGDYAFYGCIGIESITFSENTKSIGNYAFYKCEKLKTLDIQDSITEVGDRAFGNCSALETLRLGTGIDRIGERVFQNCVALKEVTIPANITSIENYAFYKCNALVSLTIENGENALSIGNYAFYGAEKLQRAYLPERLTSIGKYAFKGCAVLQSIVIGENVTEIGAHAFYGGKTLTIYVESEEPAADWNKRWNSSYCPVVYGCTLSEDGTYVVSVEIGENTFANVKDTKPFTSPKRDGYTFAGWSATVDGKEKIYQANEITQAPKGTTLTALWEPGDEPLTEDPAETEEEVASAA